MPDLQTSSRQTQALADGSDLIAWYNMISILEPKQCSGNDNGSRKDYFETKPPLSPLASGENWRLVGQNVEKNSNFTMPISKFPPIALRT